MSDPGAGVLNAGTRLAALEAMSSSPLDVLVVGGGITGAGAALDAAARGLRVGLVEATDFAAGASSKSSKLIHGGLRYLEMGDIGLVREGLRERELLLTRIAPHLVRPVPFLWPLRGRGWERVYLGAGLVLYDTLGGARSVPRHRHLSRRGSLRVAPALRGDALVGAVQFYDAAEDDARMVATVARTAAAYGAVIANRARVVELLRSGGAVVGAALEDALTGERYEIRARSVALAVGAWTDAVRGLVSGAGGVPPSFDFAMQPSKGIHIVVPQDRIQMSTGVLLRTEKSVLFIIPTDAGWLIGDTDTPWPHGPDRVVANASDVEYVLAKANSVLAEPLSRSDVVGVFAGVRPLVGRAGVGDTTRLSRNHVIETPLPGLTTIAGGKYTTYRAMSADLIDAVSGDLGPVPPSRTASVPLIGTGPVGGDVPLELATPRLRGRYGARVSELAALVAGRPELAEPLPGGAGHLGAEVVHACRYEGALRLDDVLARRTRLAITTGDRGVSAATPAASLMAEELGWTEAQMRGAVDAWARQVEAERAGEAEPDDERALRAYAAALAGEPAEAPR